MFTKRSSISTLAALVCLAVMSVSFALPIRAADGDTDSAAAYKDWQVMGPSGGDVRVITIDPRDKDHLFISTLDGEIHTSTDGGRTWRLVVSLNHPELVVDQLIVDSRDSNKLYASGYSKDGGGFFHSTDGGASWKEAKELRGESIHAMTQSPKDPNLLLVGTLKGVWISNDAGESWQKISSPTMPVNIDTLTMDPRNSNTVYAGTWWRAYKSTDTGQSWRLIKDGMIDDSDVFAITLDPRNPDHIVASACSGIYESQTAGDKWAKIQGIPSQSRRTRDIVQHPSLPGVIYAGTTEGFWMSANGGKSWSLTTQRDLEVNSIAVHPDAPNRVFIGTNNYGVMVSNDGGRNFVPSNGNFTSRLTYSVTPDLQEPNRLYAATHNTVTAGGYFFVTNDGGASWIQAGGLDTQRVRVFAVKQDPANPNIMYVGTNVGIFSSTDRGMSWTQMKPPPPKKTPVARRTARKAPVKKSAPAKPATAPPADPNHVAAITDKVQVIELLPGGGLLAGTDRGVFRSLDPTKGWDKLPFGAGFNENVYAIHIAAQRPDTIWVGTATSGVLVSRDNGQTWARTGGAVDNVPVSSITSDPKRPDYIYVGTIQTFYYTHDGGEKWTQRGGGLPLGNFTSILVNPNNTNEILLSSALGTDGGIYISTDAGQKWKRVDTKDQHLASRRFWSMAFDPQDPNRIYASTHSSGVYRIERAATTASISVNQ
jgi:photosystem II stability/assembly factor-like uncharacterized protein